METIDHKSMMGAQKIKRKESKHDIKKSSNHKEQKKGTKTAKTSRKQQNFNKYITIDNDL